MSVPGYLDQFAGGQIECEFFFGPGIRDPIGQTSALLSNDPPRVTISIGIHEPGPCGSGSVYRIGFTIEGPQDILGRNRGRSARRHFFFNKLNRFEHNCLAAPAQPTPPRAAVLDHILHSLNHRVWLIPHRTQQ